MNGTQPLPRKFHSLTGRITTGLMSAAFHAVRKNRGAAGVDRQSIGMFESQLEQNPAALRKDLKDGTFVPLPARRTYIDKGGGKRRPLGIPCVRDRTPQLASLFSTAGDPESPAVARVLRTPGTIVISPALVRFLLIGSTVLRLTFSM